MDLALVNARTPNNTRTSGRGSSGRRRRAAVSLAIFGLLLSLPVVSQAEAPGANGGAVYNALRAYAADTGEERWMAPAYGEGTPLPVRLTDGRASLTVIVSQGGSAIRAEDGRVLAVSAQGRFGGAPLAAEGDVVVFRAPQRIAAVRLLMADRDRLGWKKLWDRSVPGNAVSGAVCHGGLVFELDGPVGDELLNVVALPDGRRASTLRLSPSTAMPHGGIAPVLAGDWLFAMDSGRFPNRHAASPALRPQPPALCVIRATARGAIVGRVPVEPMGAPPVFDGGRIYLRSARALTCIARAGEEGERFEAAAAFRALADSFFADVPGRGGALTVPPSPGRPAPSWPVPATGIPAPPRWIGIGPLPARNRADALKAMGPLQAFRPQRGTRLTVRGQPCEFDDLPLSACTEYPGGWAVDALRAADEQPGSVLFWYTVVDNPAERTLRADCPDERTVLWMNGVPVRHNERVRLAPGLYPLLVEVDIPRRLPDSLEVAVRFWPSDDPGSERAAWKEAVLTHREIVDRARRALRGTEPGARARRILAAAE